MNSQAVSSRASKQNLPRRTFTPEEDAKLRALVDHLGTKSWEEIARFIPDRSARQCRDRYKNYLLDSLVTDAWTADEDALVVQKYHEIGPKWVEIGRLLSGRSGNNVKNRWHKHLCKLDESAQLPTQCDDPMAPARVEEKAAFSFAQSLGFRDCDWPHLFNTAENPFDVSTGWSSPFSFENSLF
jgi:hypothetical protein